MPTEAIPANAAPQEAKPVHARWSEVNRQFLEYVERNPESLDRASYEPIYADPSLCDFSVQPWPLFFEPPRLAGLARMAVGMDRLLKDAIERFLGNDVARVAEFYRTRSPIQGLGSMEGRISEDTIPILVEEPNGVRAAPSRADYIDTPDGLKFLEFNCGGFIGGLHTDHLCARYLECEPIAAFLRQVNRRAAPMGVCRAMFRHVVDDTVRLGAWKGGDFNVAMAVRPNRPEVLAQHSEERYNRELRAVLAQGGAGASGRVMLCGLDDLASGRGGLTLDGEPVHAVIEQHNGQGDIRPVFRAFKMEQANLFSGPIDGILTDKRNVVLLSEHADSDEFTAAERSLIQQHVPWTRRVLPGRAAFRGRPLRLPEDLVARRADLVLKKGWSWGGTCVVVGRFSTPAEWEAAVAKALREEDWVVQEFLESRPYCFQNADEGAVRHELVWGLFVFGEHFGGVHLRMQAAGRSGIVNTNQGADIGAGLVLLD